MSPHALRPALPGGDATTSLDATVLALVRHAETVWHQENRYAGGGSDIDLTAHGMDQAAQLARWATRFAPQRIVSSPVRRARETAQPSAEATGLPLEVVDDLREVDFGVAEGRTVSELAAEDAQMVDRFRADPVAHPFPGAEPPAAAADRSVAALRHMAGRPPGGRILVVAHSTVLRLALCRLIGLPLSGYRTVFPRLDNVAVTTLALPGDGTGTAALLSLNVHPSG